MISTQLTDFTIKPSAIALGCEQLGGTDWGKVDIREAREAVRCALDLGINTFDTADVYGLGRSEEELSNVLGKQRHNTFIITKFGVRWELNKTGGRALTFKDASPAYLNSAIEDSLRRLRIDTIPLYLVHWPDTNTPLENTLEALERKREQGKILNYGLSNFNIESIRRSTINFTPWGIENPYNLIQREPSEKIFKLAKNKGISTFSYGPLAQGFLTNKYRQSSRFASNDRRFRLPHFAERNWNKYTFLLATLQKIAQRHKKTSAQVAIRWILDTGLVDTIIVGAKSPRQVEINKGALGWNLEQEEKDMLERAANAVLA